MDAIGDAEQPCQCETPDQRGQQQRTRDPPRGHRLYAKKRSAARNGKAVDHAAVQARTACTHNMVLQCDGSAGTAAGFFNNSVLGFVALEMKAACEAALPADAAVCVAAVADWRADEVFKVKMKKSHEGPPTIRLVENPDLLAQRRRHLRHRPRAVFGRQPNRA